jgi:hypothetical protein
VIKSGGAKGKARVTFTIDPQAGVQAAAVCGEWNDWPADAYVHNDFGGDDSVVDPTAPAEAVPQATRRTPAKKTAPAQTARKAAPAARRAERPAK